MADAAVSTLVQLLVNVLTEKVRFLGAVGSEVEWLKDELQSMQCFLKDAEEKQTTDNRVRKWISDIRKVAFDAEDVIEIFILNVENPRNSRGYLGRCACLHKQVNQLDRVGEEIQSIRTRLEAIEHSRKTFGIEDLRQREYGDWKQIRNHIEWRRRLIPSQKDKDYVGLNKDVQLLLKAMIQDKRVSLTSATIAGLPGIGKSTLARIIYNHDEVVEGFDVREWIVLNEFQPIQIFKELILKLLENKPSERLKLLEIINHVDAPVLQEMVREELQEQRYFIVLDDVWKDEDWMSLQDAFPNNEKGSRLLITSRSQVSIPYTRFSHCMDVLGSTDSRKLFLSKALADNTEGKFPKKLEELGEKIVEKCDGLPLAINAVAGVLLKLGQSKSAWERVLEGINSHLSKNRVFDILELSYQNLPPHLKPCFLCLAFFKEDAVIRAVKLKNIWIALGLIQQGEQSMEAIATGYLEELVNQNLIQVKLISSDDQIKHCQVHDLIRELSITKAKEEMGLEMSLGEGSSSASSDKPRHRALYTPLIHSESSRNEHIRSLFVCLDVMAAPSSYWKKFELLKLLDLEDCVSLAALPEAIGALIGLTYLGLKNTAVKKLPRSFRRLKNLKVIELPDSTMLPSSAWDFISLRHVDGSVWWEEVPQKTSTLKSIRRLKRVHIGASNYELLAEMTNLCYLAIIGTSIIEWSKVFDSLHTLKNLVRLSLESPFKKTIEGLGTLRHVTHLKLIVGMTELPTYFPQNVSHLTLKYSHFEDPLPALEKLPCLSYLHLSCIRGCENLVVSSDGFSKLEILRFTSMPHLWSLQVEEGAMPELKQVEVRKCPELNSESLKKQLRPSITVDIDN